MQKLVQKNMKQPVLDYHVIPEKFNIIILLDYFLHMMDIKSSY